MRPVHQNELEWKIICESGCSSEKLIKYEVFINFSLKDATENIHRYSLLNLAFTDLLLSIQH